MLWFRPGWEIVVYKHKLRMTARTER
jgi:hypothetical protein